jgi:hypothetical protein
LTPIRPTNRVASCALVAMQAVIGSHAKPV